MADFVGPVLQQTRVVPLTRIERERVLPVPGEVLASVGSPVRPPDVVARAPGEPNLSPVPLARYMRASESTLAKYVRKQPGEPVEAREIIASKPEMLGTLERLYRAPGPGRIAAREGSWLALELSSPPIELKACYQGVIVKVMPRFGVVIQAVGALVQGAWGSGGDGYGVLKKMADSPDAILTDSRIESSIQGAVLLAGAGVTEQVIERAAREHAAGLIVGGLAPRLREMVAALTLPTIITEGFGERAMCAPIFDVLAARDGQEVSLNTTTRARGGAIRPELFIAAPSGDHTDAQPLSPLVPAAGAAVRILAAPFIGKVGKIIEVPELPRGLESGVTAWGAEIELTGGERVFVPWSNLELIG